MKSRWRYGSGAIYSLDRLYDDAPERRREVVQILAAYIRRANVQADEAAKRSEDVLAAFWTIEHHAQTAVHVNLSGAALDWGATVAGALAAPQFINADLTGAEFALWRLPEASFDRADLRHANFRSACLVGATFQGERASTGGFDMRIYGIRL